MSPGSARSRGRAGARHSAQRLPCRLDGIACLSPRRRRGCGETGVAADDLVASQRLTASREIRGERPTHPETESSPARTARRIVSTLTRAYAAASAAVINGTADVCASSAPTLASSTCRYAISGPSRTSRSWPPATSTSGPAVLPKSLITLRGQVVHCHRTRREKREPGGESRAVATLDERWLRSTVRHSPRRPPIAATAADRRAGGGRSGGETRQPDHRSRQRSPCRARNSRPPGDSPPASWRTGYVLRVRSGFDQP